MNNTNEIEFSSGTFTCRLSSTGVGFCGGRKTGEPGGHSLLSILSSYRFNFVTRLQIGNEVIQHNIAFVGDLYNKA